MKFSLLLSSSMLGFHFDAMDRSLKYYSDIYAAAEGASDPIPQRQRQLTEGP